MHVYFKMFETTTIRGKTKSMRTRTRGGGGHKLYCIVSLFFSLSAFCLFCSPSVDPKSFCFRFVLKPEHCMHDFLLFLFLSLSHTLFFFFFLISLFFSSCRIHQVRHRERTKQPAEAGHPLCAQLRPVQAL